MGNHTILVVDDDSDIREVLAEVLADAGYHIQTATNGIEALDQLRSGEPPCLMLLDLMMPIMDGYQVLSTCQQDPALASIPIAIITAGSGDLRHPVQAPLLRKPLRMPELLALVRLYC